VWPRKKKDKAPAEQPFHTIPGQPRRHARQTPDPDGAQAPVAAPVAEALILAEPVRQWLADDVARMQDAADERHATAQRAGAEREQALADEAHWRTIAAGIARILDLAQATAQRGEAAVYEQPQTLPTPPDPAEFAATWRVPDPVPGACVCDPMRGESCEQCDVLLPARTSSWWSPGASNDGLTATLATVDGEAR
jgi:hypothetical protein